MENIISLNERFPKLYYIEEYKIAGILEVECVCNDEYIKENFEIEILLDENKIPVVKEIGKKVKRNYHHIYKESGNLCLATDLEQELYLKDHTVIEWIEKYVVTYFVSYCYYKKYRTFPFGEHSHGEKGIYEFLQKYFDVLDASAAKRMLEYVSTRKYRGHFLCPCGSGKRLRNCHGKKILDLYNSNELDVLKNTYRRLKNE